jgi:predicted nucleic acid-binding protein
LPTVVADASVVIKWFHEDGEAEVEPSRELLTHFADRRINLITLDLATYEVGNVLVRSLGVGAERASIVLEALGEICDRVAPTDADLALTARLASDHELTFSDAAYAAVARSRAGPLATMDAALLKAGLGERPSAVVQRLRA